MSLDRIRPDGICCYPQQRRGMCPKCKSYWRMYHRDYMRELTRIRTAMRACIACGGAVATEGTRCSECSEKHRLYMAQRRAAKRL